MSDAQQTRPKVLVIEPSQVLYYAINARLPALLPDCDVTCLSSMNSAAQRAGMEFPRMYRA